jgi:hypothetical protein
MSFDSAQDERDLERGVFAQIFNGRHIQVTVERCVPAGGPG